MHSESQFLQGVFAFTGVGLEKFTPLAPGKLDYTVPAGNYAQPTYFRGGNSAAELVCVLLVREGQPMRYFPIGAKADVHVALAVIEDIAPGTALELQIAAPEGVSGTVIVDLGLVLTNYEY
jgi:hypothetical protein